MKELLRKAFDIREGEYQRVLLLQLNIFLLILSLLIIKPVVNAQFLSTLGIEQLPVVFIMVALAAMIVSTLYARLLNGRSLRWITSSTLSFSIAVLVIVAILLRINVAEQFVLYAFYVWVAIFGLLTTSQFWIMANLAFDAREARRLFSFIGAGAIAGGIAGGYTTSLLTPLLGSSNLLYVAAALLVICIPLNNTIWRKHIDKLNTFQRQKRMGGFGEHPLRIIRNSRHLTYLALLVGLAVVVSKLVEYQFSDLAFRSIADPDRLTSFFGFWFSTFNVVSLLIQLFITRKIVGTYGVGTSLFVLPGGLLIGAVLLIFAPIIWAAIMIKLWDVSLKQSVNKSAVELLALPIPINIKNQTKSFIDVFVDSAATGIGGLLLIFIVVGLDLSTTAISILIVLLLIPWVIVAFGVRKEYIKSFKEKLIGADSNGNRGLPDLRNTSVLDGLRNTLNSGNEQQLIFSLEKIVDLKEDRLSEDVIRLLNHRSSKVQAKALECLYFLGNSIDTAILEKLLHDTDLIVRSRAFEQLLSQTPDRRLQIIQTYIRHDDPRVSSSALIGLAEEVRNNPELRRVMKVEQLIREKMSILEHVEHEDERVLYQTAILLSVGHARIQNLYPELYKSINSEHEAVIQPAILASGLTIDPQFIEVIIPFLSNESKREAAQTALVNYGEGLTQKLSEYISQGEPSSNVLIAIPGVLERIGSQKSVDLLLTMLSIPEPEIRLEALRSLNTLRKDFPFLVINNKQVIEFIIDEANVYKKILAALYAQSHLVVNFSQKASQLHQGLTNLLEERLDGTLERIFRLLGLCYPPDDIIPVYEGIKNKNQDIRINSVEFLENLLEPNLKKTLIPIAESALLEAISDEAIRMLKMKAPDEEECYSLLLGARDTKLRLIALKLIAEIGDKRYAFMVKNVVNDPDAEIRSAAKTALMRLT